MYLNLTQAAKLLTFVLITAFSAYAAADGTVSKSQEVSDKEGIPVLIMHLPDWETKRDTAVFVNKAEDLLTYLDERPVLREIDFIPGTEAVIASYPEGKLLIIEFATPQASSDADERVVRAVEAQRVGGFFYRRIGNYNVFLFDGTDESAANALFDKIKYQKVVQWLGAEPALFAGGESERDFIVGTSSLFISTVIVILAGFATSTVLGVIIGLLFFYFREQRRSTMPNFSDAGGMTRLNLDGLTPAESVKKLFGK
jgi:hypothetical protein